MRSINLIAMILGFAQISISTSSCNDTKLNGSAQVAPAQKTAPSIPQTPVQSAPYVAETVAPSLETLATVADPNPPVADQQTAVDGVVDGMDVVTDCNRCVQRAQELSSKIGFAATVANAISLGFYKIDPSKNLCDIHFLANAGVKIGDHEGRDSTLDNQVAIYCPCNCGWQPGPAGGGPDFYDQDPQFGQNGNQF